MRKAALIAIGLVLVAEALQVLVVLVVVALTIPPEPDRQSDDSWMSIVWLALALAWAVFCAWGAVRVFLRAGGPKPDGWTREFAVIAAGHVLAALTTAMLELTPFDVVQLVLAALLVPFAAPRRNTRVRQRSVRAPS